MRIQIESRIGGVEDGMVDGCSGRDIVLAGITTSWAAEHLRLVEPLHRVLTFQDQDQLAVLDGFANLLHKDLLQLKMAVEFKK